MADRSPQTLETPDRPVRQCREIFLHQIAAALAELDAGKPNVHGARKQLKRARGTLRLLRPAIGDERYRSENMVARDAARPLSRARDGEALEEVLEELLDHFGRSPPDVHLGHGRHEVSGAQVARIRGALANSSTRAAAWQLDSEGWDCIETGLRATYRRGRRALRHARKDRATEDLHEWRKQAKYLWHQLQILTPLAAGPIGELADEFHHLADYLGDEHDLAVLRERVRTSGELQTLIDSRRNELQEKALALGERLYANKSKPFMQRLAAYWVPGEE
jgi:CHAD domain-containing protein